MCGLENSIPSHRTEGNIRTPVRTVFSLILPREYIVSLSQRIGAATARGQEMLIFKVRFLM